jgi:hypothetical protein
LRPGATVDGTGSPGVATERLGDLGSPDDPDTVFVPCEALAAGRNCERLFTPPARGR